MENPCFPFLFYGWSLHIFQCPISLRASPWIPWPFRDSADLPVGTYAGRFTPTLPGIYKLQAIDVDSMDFMDSNGATDDDLAGGSLGWWLENIR